MSNTYQPVTLACRIHPGVTDPQHRGIVWHVTYPDGGWAWNPVVFESHGNRSLGLFGDATEALKAWREFVPFILSAAA